MRADVVDWEGHRTWYRVDGELDAGPLPLVALHGGPGVPHDYLEPLADFAAQAGRPVVLYDQLGCGRSDHLPDEDASFWTVELFLRELDAVLDHLGIAERYHLLGQSWGGMLALEHAVRRPTGLRSLVIANSPASMELWVAEANRLRAALPPDVDATLRRHEEAGTTDSPEYEAATLVFYERHVCRLPRPWPECVERAFAKLARDPTVYHTMNGPSEFHCVGTLRGWDITPRLADIAVPTLLVSGEFDEATPAAVGPLAEGIPDATWEIVAGTSHLTHVEAPGEFRRLVERALATHDGPGRG